MATATAAAISSFIGMRLCGAHSGLRRGSGSDRRRRLRERARVRARVDRCGRAKGPEWLNGRLGKPAEYLQFELDSLEQNLAKNEAGIIIGTKIEVADMKSTPFSPYNEVFGLQKFLKRELIHGRWAMVESIRAEVLVPMAAVGRRERESTPWG
ncbi:Chlorophyll a-b binding protein CP29.2, chloroplastic, partial [Mucuna pruriens]